GYATAETMYNLGCSLILTARTREKSEALSKKFARAKIITVDFEDLNATVAFARQVADFNHFPDFTLLNHGIQCKEKCITPEVFEKTLQVNFISQLLIVEAWLRSGCLSSTRETVPKKIGFVSSGMHRLEEKLHWDDLNFEDRTYSFKDAYCQSKLLQLVYMGILTIEAPQVTWFATEPGPVKTDIYRPSSGFEKPPWEGFEDRPTPDMGAYPGVHGFMEDIGQGAFLSVPDGRPGEISAVENAST
ncbi:MAG: SDR family NAD(P)-dependent oxidoreductase, partial [Rickettsia endosymbiont of Ixodes persulcatus]|nr:SDR family NAD(P)-dependent oxidoreductase [Rickettsia endosymbiont of Ixodes persulcatus]